jgi:ribonucleoside-diphosphate reductase alpha chain
MQFIPGYREANAPKRGRPVADLDHSAPEEPVTGRVMPVSATGIPEDPPAEPRVSASATIIESKSSRKALATKVGGYLAVEASTLTVAMESMGDAPPCDVCGTITNRSGTCYKCHNCGNSMGCS